MKIDMIPSLSDKKKCPPIATDNFDTLVDIKLLLLLACFQPLFTIVHYLIKFAQVRDVFVSDFL